MSKIAIIINDRQEEAIRMSSGITILDDEVELFFIDTTIDGSAEIEMMLEIAEEMELPIYSNVKNNEQTTQLSTEECYHKLLEFDHIINY